MKLNEISVGDNKISVGDIVYCSAMPFPQNVKITAIVSHDGEEEYTSVNADYFNYALQKMSNASISLCDIHSIPPKDRTNDNKVLTKK